MQPSFTIAFFLPSAENRQVGHAYEELSKLTPAEQAVARFAAAGHHNADIACELGVSQSTVRTHLRHIFEKLGITTRAHLAPLHPQLAEVNATR